MQAPKDMSRGSLGMSCCSRGDLLANNTRLSAIMYDFCSSDHCPKE